MEYERKPRCDDGCKETEEFTANDGRVFKKCKACENLVFNKKCKHLNLEPTARASKSDGRMYFACVDCNGFAKWADNQNHKRSRGEAFVDTSELEKRLDELTTKVLALEAKICAEK